jgi:hypothetical protein
MEKIGWFKKEGKMLSVSKKNTGNIFSSSGSFQVRLLLTWSLVSLFLKVKSKLATGNSVPSSQISTKISNEWKPSQPNDENFICLPTKAEDIRTVDVGHGNLCPG